MASDAVVNMALDVEGFSDDYRHFLFDYACTLIDNHNMTEADIVEIENMPCIGIAYDDVIISAIKQELIDRQNGEGWNDYSVIFT